MNRLRYLLLFLLLLLDACGKMYPVQAYYNHEPPVLLNGLPIPVGTFYTVRKGLPGNPYDSFLYVTRKATYLVTEGITYVFMYYPTKMPKEPQNGYWPLSPDQRFLNGLPPLTGRYYALMEDSPNEKSTTTYVYVTPKAAYLVTDTVVFQYRQYGPRYELKIF
jgi:hypothetical protein